MAQDAVEPSKSQNIVAEKWLLLQKLNVSTTQGLCCIKLSHNKTEYLHQAIKND